MKDNRWPATPGLTKTVKRVEKTLEDLKWFDEEATRLQKIALAETRFPIRGAEHIQGATLPRARKRVWGIWSSPIGAPAAGEWIQSSIGKPHAELRSIARRMNCDGDGWTQSVRETHAPNA